MQQSFGEKPDLSGAFPLSYKRYIFPDSLSLEVMVRVLGREDFYERVYVPNRSSLRPESAFAFYHTNFYGRPFAISELLLLDPAKPPDTLQHLSETPILYLKDPDPYLLHQLMLDHKDRVDYDCDICAW